MSNFDKQIRDILEDFHESEDKEFAISQIKQLIKEEIIGENEECFDFRKKDHELKIARNQLRSQFREKLAES